MKTHTVIISINSFEFHANIFYGNATGLFAIMFWCHLLQQLLRYETIVEFKAVVCDLYCRRANLKILENFAVQSRFRNPCCFYTQISFEAVAVGNAHSKRWEKPFFWKIIFSMLFFLRPQNITSRAASGIGYRGQKIFVSLITGCTLLV